MNRLHLFLYMIISTLYLVVSFKYSGAEAYHYSGLFAYIKWSFISVIINLGFLIQLFRPEFHKKLIVMLLMLSAIVINILIYSNPKGLLSYFLLSLSLFLLSLFFVAKGVFNNAKNLHA